jgi:tRNA-2-methylthio-N6-dimethylallyladenosine synthase
MRSYFVWNIGCQMNAADGQRVAERLMGMGLTAATAIERADVIVLISCVVRQGAEDKVWGRLTSLKPLKQRRPDTFVALMGCAVPPDVSGLASRFPYVNALIRPSDVDGLVRAVASHLGGEATDAVLALPEQLVSRGITAMEGCNHACTYCIVQLRRGQQVSRPMADVVGAARRAVAAGAREIVLLGQNVDGYGRDLAEPCDLADMLAAVHDIDAVRRVRFLTSHPADLSPRVIDAVATLARVCEQFELPVQSGDDAVLRRMGRRYSVQQYRDLVDRIRRTIPHAAIATDVIVGFPGEADAQFEATLALVQELRFDAVHVAAYSPRPGTPAARLDDDVPVDEKERRRKAIDGLQERIVGELNARLVGQTVEVLVEERHKGKWRGRTRGNKLVFFQHADDWRGRLASVRIEWAGPWSMRGAVEGTLHTTTRRLHDEEQG